MTWNAPAILYLLWLVPGLAVAMIFASYVRRNTLARLGDPELIGRLMASRDRRKRFLKNFLVLLALAAAIVALAQPRTLSRKVHLVREGVDLTIVVDVSMSMLADDIKPSRIGYVREQLDRLVVEAPVDRISLMAFSGGTQVLAPLTGDRKLIRRLLTELRPETVPVKGSMLGAAMQAGVDSFQEKQRKARVLLLISDGEDDNPFPIHLAERARNEGISLFVAGVGRPEGHTIPVAAGSGSNGFLMDSEGKLVYTRLNEELMMKIAETSGGTYCADDSSSVPFVGTFLQQLDSINKAGAFEDVVIEYENRFQWPLLVAVIGLLIEVSISERRRMA
jgi:Ca-activated chloride channel family protein